MKALVKLLERHGLPMLLIIGGLFGAIVSAQRQQGSDYSVMLFLALSLIGIFLEILFGVGITGPRSPVAKWILRRIHHQARHILRRIQHHPIDDRRVSFTSQVKGLLEQSEYIGALCGQKDLGVADVMTYYKMFFYFATHKPGTETRVIRAFMYPFNVDHVTAHCNTDYVTALTIINPGKIDKIEKTFPGLGALLKRGFGFVILVMQSEVKVVIHEIERGTFVFWSLEDRIAIEHVVDLFKEICTASEERQKEEPAIRHLESKVDNALRSMPITRPVLP